MRQENQSNVTTLLLGAKPQQKLSTLRFYNDEFVFDTESGMFYRLNPTACFLLHALDSGANSHDLPAMLQTRYGLDRSTALRDVELFFNEVAKLEAVSRRDLGDRARE